MREASKRLETLPAVFETVTERVKVADASREWKKGRSWISTAINVRPATGFSVGVDGRIDGAIVTTKPLSHPQQQARRVRLKRSPVEPKQPQRKTR